MKTNTEEFDFFKPDKYKLDEEWEGQPELYFEYAVKLADARSEHEHAITQQDLIEAELDRDIRSNPIKYDVAKITEGSVEKVILTQRGYQACHEVVLKAKHRVDVLQAAVTALDHRKKAIEGLVQLWLADFYSKPLIKGENREKMDEMQERNTMKKIKIHDRRK